MGCDIHVCCEARWTIDGVKKWYSVDHYKKNKYYIDEDKCSETEWDIVPIFDDRNYILFSILADVRNYSNNKPICEPRGLPDDVSKTVKKEADDWGCDGHSHSWFTLKELLNYKLEHSKEHHSGYISEQQAKDWEKGVTPDSWCQSTNISGYVYKEWDDELTSSFQKLINALMDRACKEFYIYSWMDDSNKKKAIEKIANDIRIVFWFDN